MLLAQMLPRRMTLSKKAEGYHVIYIGKNHPEPEGAVGIAPDIVHLIERADDLKH